MILFAQPGMERLASQTAERAVIQQGGCRVRRFANEELYIELDTDVAGRECCVIASFAPPAERLTSALLLAHTLRKDGASRVVMLAPYLAYSRHDTTERGKSCALAAIGGMLKACGVDELVTVDIHSQSARDLLPMPCISLSPASILSDHIQKIGLEPCTIVAPDEGAIERAEAVRIAARIAPRIAYLSKERGSAGVKHRSLHGGVGLNAVVVDDILDTGATLISCCRILREHGVQTITIFATHGLFTGSEWQQVWRLGVDQIVSTDTIPRAEIPAGVAQVSVAGLLSDYLCSGSDALGERAAA